MKKALAILTILTVLFSCSNEINPIQFEIKPFNESYAASIEVTIEKAKGYGSIANNINTNIEKELMSMIPNNEDSKTLEDAVLNYDKEYRDFKMRFEEESQTWELSLETEVIYQSESVLTIGLSSYIDTGGAHGNNVIKLLNFNPKTGQLYDIDDLIMDKFQYMKTAKDYFSDYVKKEGRDYAEFFFGEAFKLPKNIGFSEEGLILLYNVYEIASYSEGYTEITIPFDTALSFLKITP